MFLFQKFVAQNQRQGHASHYSRNEVIPSKALENPCRESTQNKQPSRSAGAVLGFRPLYFANVIQSIGSTSQQACNIAGHWVKNNKMVLL